jgi:hypothetical protein
MSAQSSRDKPHRLITSSASGPTRCAPRIRPLCQVNSVAWKCRRAFARFGQCPVLCPVLCPGLVAVVACRTTSAPAGAPPSRRDRRRRLAATCSLHRHQPTVICVTIRSDSTRIAIAAIQEPRTRDTMTCALPRRRKESSEIAATITTAATPVPMSISTVS